MIGSPRAALDGERYFRWRAHEISRLEGFSDAVFAFAITLLVVSLEVPKTFNELANTMRGFVAFAICFTLLATLWREHCIYFRRYGFQTGYVNFLNSVLLFVVLFYVYPLKFLFSFLVAEVGGYALSVRHSSEPALLRDQVPALMVMYGLGMAAVYLVFVLLYTYAYRKRAPLELSEVETFITKCGAFEHLALMIFGLASAGLAVLLPRRVAGFSGFVYWLIPVYFTIAGTIVGKRTRLMAAKAERELQDVVGIVPPSIT
jgi:uncharacterized membrane protein